MFFSAFGTFSDTKIFQSSKVSQREASLSISHVTPPATGHVRPAGYFWLGPLYL